MSGLNALIGGKTTQRGVRGTKSGEVKSRFARFCAFLGISALTALALPASAQTVTIAGSVDAVLSDTNGDGVFDSFNNVSILNNGLVIRQFENFLPPSVSFEDRSIVQFSLASLPTNIVVDKLTFNFNEIAATSNVGRVVGVFGYGGSGSVALSDATASATQLGSYDNFAVGLGLHNLDLATSKLQSLLGTGELLGLRLQGNELTVNTTISSIEQANAGIVPSAPSITVTYHTANTSVPEPGAFALLAATAGSGIIMLRRRRI